MTFGKLVMIASLWKKSSSQAGEYFSGVIANIPEGLDIKKGMKVLIFKNKNPQQNNSPTHFLMVPEPEKKGEDHEAVPPKDEEPKFE